MVFDDEAVRGFTFAARECGYQVFEGGNRQECRPCNCCRSQLAAGDAARVEAEHKLFARFTVQNRDCLGYGLMAGETRADGGQALWIARTDDDAGDAGQHGTIHGIDQGQFDLMQEIDADDAVVAFFGQPDFGKRRDDQEFDQLFVKL